MTVDQAEHGNDLPARLKPRILLLCDQRGWAYDTTAQNLVSRLSDRFEFDIQYVAEKPELDESKYDLIYVFWWGERFHRRFVSDKTKIVKEISSHRWEFEQKYGQHTAQEALDRYIHDADYLVATSKRLFSSFDDCHPRVFHYSLGVDTDLFRPTREKAGALTIGWAGNIRDPKKRVHEILFPACGENFKLELAEGGLTPNELTSFYNDLDVVCVSSTEEGTPLPLIEAMACCCFPVTTDVGVAAELIVNGENGLIVEPSPESFRSAFEWCQENLRHVRTAGKENALLIKRERSWDASATQYAEVLEDVLRIKADSSVDAATSGNSPGYDKHFERINPAGYSDGTYRASYNYFLEDVEPLLPKNKDSRILEVGTGFGHFIRYLADKGYSRVTGIDISEELMEGVRERLAHRVEKLEVADARDYLPAVEDSYDCIVMLDMIEHVTKASAEDLLSASYRALKPGGRIILRTPNMANLLGSYSLHMDYTHWHGYTEWSLLHILELAGFQRANAHVPNVFATRKRKVFAAINRQIHQFIFRLNDKAPPKWFGKNVVVWADR
jgi:glycosyltransferase involved in cell wall biosynthesis/2-polyprenyl-3-methyl-5-hydroxy-6-metoxy-1,4-benzoquinol methylase